jgi:hypothetical protein
VLISKDGASKFDGQMDSVINSWPVVAKVFFLLEIIKLELLRGCNYRMALDFNT